MFVVGCQTQSPLDPILTRWYCQRFMCVGIIFCNDVSRWRRYFIIKYKYTINWALWHYGITNMQETSNIKLNLGTLQNISTNVTKQIFIYFILTVKCLTDKLFETNVSRVYSVLDKYAKSVQFCCFDDLG